MTDASKDRSPHRREGIRPPLWIIVLSDLTGDPTEPLQDVTRRRLVEVDVDSVEEQMHHFNAGLRLRVPNRLSEDGGEMAIQLSFRHPKDFAPLSLIGQVPALRALYRTASDSRYLLQQLTGETPGSLLAAKFYEYNVRPEGPGLAFGPEAFTRGEAMIRQLREWASFEDRMEVELAIDAVDDYAAFARSVGLWRIDDRIYASGQPLPSLQSAVSACDQRIAEQLAEIICHPNYQNLKRAWWGLLAFVKQLPRSRPVRVSVMNISKRELVRLCRRDELSRRAWQRMRRAWGTSRLISLHDEMDWPDLPVVAGQPIGLLVGDFEFGINFRGFDIIRQLADFGSALHAPVLLGFDYAAFQDEPMSLLEYTRIAQFRSSEAACYLAMAAPAFPCSVDYSTSSSEDWSGYRLGLMQKRNQAGWAGAAYALAMEVVADVAMDSGDNGDRGISSGSREIVKELWSGRSTCAPEEMRPIGVVMLPRYAGMNRARIPYPYVAHKSIEKGADVKVRSVVTTSRIAQNLRLLARIKAADDPVVLQSELQAWLDKQIVGQPASGLGLPDEPTVASALITIEFPREPPTYYKGRLTYPRYFEGHLAARLRDAADEIRLRVPLYRSYSQ